MILLALNELNIEFIESYIEVGELPNFKKLLSAGTIKTSSEHQYELLEPWIQWVTVHTGLSYADHKVYRLGDIVNRKDLKQIFEELEDYGLSVGAVSPFNADNRTKNSKFFIPDPWTQTKPSGGFLIKKLSHSISKFVNSNATGKIKMFDIFWLFIGFLGSVPVKNWGNFAKFIFLVKKPGIKATILDMILLEVFLKLHRKHRPDYSHLFFNGGAHIQHHYMFNSGAYKKDNPNPDWYCPANWDPLLIVLKEYDRIIGKLLSTGEHIIGLTGLQQVPHNKNTFYWRPVNHSELLDEIGISCKYEVIPRMSRDFLIKVSNENEANDIQIILDSYRDSISGLKVFNIDNRGCSLFVELVYSKDIDNDIEFISDKGPTISNLKKKLAFVAIKNGKHDGNGFLFSNKETQLSRDIHLSEVYQYIKSSAIAEFEK